MVHSPFSRANLLLYVYGIFLDTCVVDPTRTYQIIAASNNFIVHHASSLASQVHYDAAASVTDAQWFWFTPINGTANVYMINSTSANVVVDGTSCEAPDQVVQVWSITTGCAGGSSQWWRIISYFGYCTITNVYNDQSWTLVSNNLIQLSSFVGNSSQMFQILGK